MRSYSSISSRRCGIMGKTRALALLLCLALCLGGCVNRPAPAPVPTAAPTEIPAAPTAEPIPVAPADPTATPVPTPTPGGDPTPAPPAEACAHPEWVNGICTVCGAECAHPAWANGRCTVCASPCRHPSHDARTLVCSHCGEVVPHNFLNSQCEMCGAKPKFTQDVLLRREFTAEAPAGTVQTLTYLTHDYYTEGQTWGYAPLTKKMCVYLPYGYDPSEKYDVMILVHGTGGTETYWLLDAQQIISEPGFGVYTKDLLDHLMATGWCRKMIIATPCFYRDGENQGDYERKRDEEQFMLELRNDILPTLVNTYSTYAASSAQEDIAAARNHFAYAGLSMGSIYVYTSIMRECLDLFAWYGCFSGSEAREYMNALITALNAEENAHYPILYFYNSAGGSDSMFAEHKDDYKKLVAAVGALSDGKNAAFTEIRATAHSYKAWSAGLYNFLRVVFAQPQEYD